MTNDKIKDIYSEILSDFGAWFGQIICLAFYNTDVNARTTFPMFSVTKILAQIYQTKGQEIPKQLIDSEKYIIAQTKELLAGDKPPSEKIFLNFLRAYDGMASLIHRLEKDELLFNNGIDPQTGLRSESAMIADLERELERRARRGQPFCLALIKIDNPKYINNSEKNVLAVNIIQKTLRSFDDAYVTGKGDYLVSLKHADVTGALKFSKRLSDALKHNEHVDFSMSCCVVEPLPGDDIAELIENTRKDLNHISALESGATGQYEDLSPLNRFIQTMNDEKNKK